MIKEEFVSFETAKLLKEVGFPQTRKMFEGNDIARQRARKFFPDFVDKEYCSTECWYTPDGKIVRATSLYRKEEDFARPTQALAMRWLREHEVVVIVDVEYFRYDIKNAKYRYNIYPNDCAKQTRSQYTYPTYEAAAEAGIQAACEYLIEKQNQK